MKRSTHRTRQLIWLEALLRSDARISLMVNNAGTATVTPLLNTDVDKMSELIAINIDALVRLTYAAAPAFCAAWRRDHHQHRLVRRNPARNA
jgi:short-subunit dehydrogenase